MQIALFVLGVALIGCGVWLLVRPKVAGARSRNTIELLGMKFQVAGPALVFVALGGAMALAAAGIVGSEPEPKPKPDLKLDPKPPPASAVAFTPRYTFPSEKIKQTAYRAAPSLDNQPVLVLDRCEFGELKPTGLGVRVTLTFKNAENVPVTLKVEPRHFSLRDNQSRRAEPMSVEGPVGAEILGARQERTIVVVFNTSDWHGKEKGATKLFLEIAGLRPVENAEWELIPLISQPG